ncbi:dihydrodipicolinate reductase [Bernardetia litoralis DSM 6794]|uniref:4-hydroxy-tetrahydrodipicolinate reductase n=1 Tax=Bernardetia litoralis (strain ATCC 23117 / DSM 6794 / NBRC 15988 / NCIMB 1366 / Fx l1 / Sio-4) TaxID=880071 RepID=I4AK63_BERLS|nr:4-hydroxy-tetrahydrodipicolinate reductase [Bernardetia litoralis]AFM04348.1 dihydrodipicolinate reductase [Bernardetia litoralis DSM 6794]
MKIALLGYGKMGKEIEQIALQKGHSISFKITRQNKEDLQKLSSQNTDVVIEFTSPESAYENVKFCLEKGVSVVCGSTGWNEQKKEIEKLALEKNLAFFWASNFSVGVNIFLEINAFAAKLMQSYQDYDLEITEIHHTEKKDAPSGTAITLAETILKNYDAKQEWQLVENNKRNNDNSINAATISIFAEREEDVKGTHTTTYSSSVDEISITHKAYSREGFAKGAVLATEFLNDKKGVFGMKDLLKID